MQTSFPISAIIVAASFSLAIVSEFISWFWVYRKADYQRLAADIIKRKKQLEAETKVAEHSTKKSASQRLKVLQEQYKALVQEGSWKTMKAQLAPTVILMMLLPLLMPRMKGIVVAQLPFEPVWLFKSITQQGLENPAPTDCSATCLFFLAVASARSLIRKLIPVPELPSLFETATQQQ
eukprot:Gregarina_sp_Poly_1__3293@NODE_1946_length_3023_cov_243_550406_g346_i1_p2_GENE_NODE_1946_length_3023_cov_243_550406_g346_i1NODE_1946_length_3023_cov_243_550406_g346_i1_p2_ORF_typecomplete_len179_score31_83EMC3_TMCO1/PF01956_16/3_9e28CHD5/PF04420_14/0_039_NODE_1946_length_3023_cov_243_550406_g346_i1367903